ncbi:MAG: 1-acyl-sn-glycerol-3-phosphate acyltransferase [Armatimonadetes bacterium]|nr:1-acyl-sn-glycerol-3-phosphate acyltransferase [Armatimonadota bacterium]
MTTGDIIPQWYWFAAWVARTLFFQAMGGCRVVGKENVPREGPVLVAPVHCSHLDPPLVGSTCPRMLRFMAKEELFRNALFGKLIRSLGAFPVKRGESDAAAIRRALQWLQGGEAVLVFPEGGRNDGETMNAVLPGTSVLAKRSGAAIVPVGLGGTAVMFPRGARRPKRGRTTVVYGRPFTFDEAAPSGDRDEFARFLSERIAEACREAGLELRTSDATRDRSGSRRLRTPSSSPDPEADGS